MTAYSLILTLLHDLSKSRSPSEHKYAQSHNVVI